MFVASLFIESLKLCVHRLPCRRFPDIRRNEKSHSSKISLRKVALNKRNFYYFFPAASYCFLPFPVLFSVIGYCRHEFCCTLAVLFYFKGSEALILLHFSTQRLQGRERQSSYFIILHNRLSPLFSNNSTLHYDVLFYQ